LEDWELARRHERELWRVRSASAGRDGNPEKPGHVTN